MGSSEGYYTKEDVTRALTELGLEDGDVVFSHSNIAFCGPMSDNAQPGDIAQVVLEAFLQVLGPAGTFIVPTFTYSFPRNEIYDPAESKSGCGFFTEHIRKRPGAFRSLDPCVSVAAIGERAHFFTSDLPGNAYAEGSFFDKFYKAQGKICNINFDAASTFIHYVERQFSVPYRFDKTFKGKIRTRNQLIDSQSTLWVRHIEEGTLPDFRTFHRYAVEKGCYKTKRVGRGSIGVISAHATYALIAELLPLEPLFLTVAGNP